jgi:hypothetical protein
MIARRRPVRAGRRWPARRTSNHARTSLVDRATDDPMMRAATSYWAPFQIHPERRISRTWYGSASTTERDRVSGVRTVRIAESGAHVLDEFARGWAVQNLLYALADAPEPARNCHT